MYNQNPNQYQQPQQNQYQNQNPYQQQNPNQYPPPQQNQPYPGQQQGGYNNQQTPPQNQPPAQPLQGMQAAITSGDTGGGVSLAKMALGHYIAGAIKNARFEWHSYQGNPAKRQMVLLLNVEQCSDANLAQPGQQVAIPLRGMKLKDFKNLGLGVGDQIGFKIIDHLNGDRNKPIVEYHVGNKVSQTPITDPEEDGQTSMASNLGFDTSSQPPANQPPQGQPPLQGHAPQNTQPPVNQSPQGQPTGQPPMGQPYQQPPQGAPTPGMPPMGQPTGQPPQGQPNQGQPPIPNWGIQQQ